MGPNYEGLKQKVESMSKLALNEKLVDIKEKWVPFGTKFQIYYNEHLDPLYRAETTA